MKTGAGANTETTETKVLHGFWDVRDSKGRIPKMLCAEDGIAVAAVLGME